MDYLGHVITDQENLVHPKQIAELRNYPTPTTARKVRAFLWSAGWLREFIPRFSEKAAPLTDHITTKQKFRSTFFAQETFDTLKAEASKPLRLALLPRHSLFLGGRHGGGTKPRSQ